MYFYELYLDTSWFFGGGNGLGLFVCFTIRFLLSYFSILTSL